LFCFGGGRYWSLNSGLHVYCLSHTSSPFSYVFFFWWDWDLNSGLHTCKAGAPLLEPHLQSIFLCFVVVLAVLGAYTLSYFLQHFFVMGFSG
jgi:hypothetical protein